MQPNQLLRAIKILAYVAVAAVPLVFFRYSMFPFGIPKIFLFQGIIALMAGAYLGLLAMEWPSRLHWPKKTPLLWSVLAFSAVLVLAGALGADPFRSFWSTIDRTMGVVGILHFAVFYLVLNGMRGEFSWPRIWQVSFWTSSLVGASVLLSKWGLHTFFLRQGTSRPGGTFGNATFAGAYILFNVFLAVWLWREAKKPWHKYFIAAGALLQIAAIFVAQTIGIIAGLGAGIGLLLLLGALAGRGNARKASLGILILGIVLLGTVFLTREAGVWQKVPGLSRITSISAGQSDVQDRLVAWRSAWAGFKEKPILGWGWENSNISFNANYDPKLALSTLEGTFFDKPHSVYLEHLVTGGILGFLAYLALFAALIFELWKASRKSESFRRIVPYLTAALGAYLLQNAIAFDTIGTYLMVFLMFAAADAAFAPAERREEIQAAFPAWKTALAAGALVAGVLPAIFLNGPVLLMANRYYWGANYFLNSLLESSNLSWQKALAMRTPYRDYVRKDYASTVMQGFTQGLRYPDLDRLQKDLGGEMEKVAAHHPQDYFFHIFLADYYVTFEPFGKTAYLEKIKEQVALAKTLSPRRQQIYYVEARERLLEHDNKGALAALREAIALNPAAGDPHFTLGMLSYGLGDIKTGDAEIKLAAELGRTPRNPQEAINLAGFVGDMKGDYKASAEYLRQALNMALQGQNKHQVQEVRLKLGVACYLSGQAACARDQFNVLKGEIDLKTLSIWENLRPALDELGVKY